ncbi:MAG: capsular biosynthesis protein, partial [Bacteroidota bacterium]
MAVNSGYPFERDPFDFDSSRESRSNLLDFKRILSRAIWYWYLPLLTLSISFAIAWAVNRYSTSIYTIKASILIKESEENVGAKLLYNNALVDPYRNFYNELYILKSLPLIQSVVGSLGFEKRYFREGEIKTTEIYSANLPFEFVIAGAKSFESQVRFKQIDESSFNFYSDFLEDYTDNQVYKFSDTIDFNNSKIVVFNRHQENSNYIGRQLIITFSSIEDVANSYVSRINASWQ